MRWDSGPVRIRAAEAGCGTDGSTPRRRADRDRCRRTRRAGRALSSVCRDPGRARNAPGSRLPMSQNRKRSSRVPPPSRFRNVHATDSKEKARVYWVFRCSPALRHPSGSLLSAYRGPFQEQRLRGAGSQRGWNAEANGVIDNARPLVSHVFTVVRAPPPARRGRARRRRHQPDARPDACRLEEVTKSGKRAAPVIGRRHHHQPIDPRVDRQMPWPPSPRRRCWSPSAGAPSPARG